MTILMMTFTMMVDDSDDGDSDNDVKVTTVWMISVK